MGENIYRIFDVVWKLSLVGGYCVLLVLLARLLLKKPPMVFLSAVGNCICAVVLSGVATDGDQSDSREAAGGWNGDDVRAVGRRLW